MVSWIIANKEWIFSGVGIAIIGGAITLIIGRSKNGRHSRQDTHINIAVSTKSKSSFDNTPATSDIKAKTHILFIDDDSKFQVVSILKKAGWINTKRIRDVYNTDDAEVKCAHILFIDIQGVGVGLGFKDEGLGLALALKNKYPDKKVIIYSAENKGDRFHEALRKADSFLPKNAEPYEFQQLVEDYSKELI
jgi:hypothetical protein